MRYGYAPWAGLAKALGCSCKGAAGGSAKVAPKKEQSLRQQPRSITVRAFIRAHLRPPLRCPAMEAPLSPFPNVPLYQTPGGW
jgi:hypothetical protein